MVASKSEKRKQAIKNGYRSGLEDDISKDLTERGVEYITYIEFSVTHSSVRVRTGG